MSIEFNCKQCGRLLRTGDDTAGRMAQCPECGSQTQVPIPAATEYPSSNPFAGGGSESDSYRARPADTAEYPGTAPSASGQGFVPGGPGNPVYALQRVSAPATCLIITAVLGLLLGVVNFFGVFTDAHFNNRLPQEFKQLIVLGPIAVVQSILVLIMGVVVLIGASKMKSLENYGFAMAASIISLIPCTSPCCCLGLPFGIWAIVILSDPVVKASFKS
jgi:hypothetical protein